MPIKKYLDWKGYFEGLYLSWIKTLTTSLITYGGTNAIEQTGVKAMKGIGMTWEQGLAMLVAITFWEIIRYLNQKPMPEEKEEQV